MFLHLLLASLVRAEQIPCTRLRYLNKLQTKINIIDYEPDIIYQKTSRTALIKKTGNKDVLGLTVAPLIHNLELKTTTIEQGNTLCVFIHEVDFHFGYQRQYVYIDARYPEGSCEYNTILEHEDLHVDFNNQALKRYRRPFTNTIRQSFRNIEPLRLKNDKYASRNIALWQEKLQEIPYIDQLKTEMKNFQDLKHGHIDSDHNYKRTNRKCKNW